ncbi:MAG: hypothetical protein MI976_24275 [Pseudomonadales bacterium]|nr:hypothetical protein [Pseudomonadales bacterium]
MKKQTPLLLGALVLLIAFHAQTSPLYEGKDHRIISHSQTDFAGPVLQTKTAQKTAAQEEPNKVSKPGNSQSTLTKEPSEKSSTTSK